jgi:DNA recombination protein RmuC
MNVVIVGLLVIIALLLTVLILNQTKSKTSNEGLVILQQQLESLRIQTNDTLLRQQQIVNEQLSQITRQITEQLNFLNQQFTTTTGQIGVRLDRAAQVIADVSKGLGSLSEATKQILDAQKDLSKLEEILSIPKTRGLLGEYFLEDLLRQILPQEYYEFQYQFRNGKKVDAIIKLGPQIVPIDAKFPLEQFKSMTQSDSDAERKRARKEFLKAVRHHIDTIARNYILPDEGTYDFAMMYIPAENLYYEVIIKEEGEEESISRYALNKRVIPVSPNSIFAYLQAIVLGLRGLRIEERSKEILAALQKLTNDFNLFKEDFRVLGTHLRNAQSKFTDAERSLIYFEQKLTGVSAIKADESKELDDLR